VKEIVFNLATDFIELYKLLKAAGLCENGAAAKHAVADAQVKVDGQIETRKGCKLRKGSRVEFANEVILVQ
jgi:ribosome-associated protein